MLFWKRKNKEEKEIKSLNIRINYGTSVIFDSHEAMNISKGGLFIKTKRPEPVGSTVNFIFSFPDIPQKIAASGEVVFNEIDPEMAGMGIKFKDLSPEGLSLIAKYAEEFSWQRKGVRLGRREEKDRRVREFQKIQGDRRLSKIRRIIRDRRTLLDRRLGRRILGILWDR